MHDDAVDWLRWRRMVVLIAYAADQPVWSAYWSAYWFPHPSASRNAAFF